MDRIKKLKLNTIFSLTNQVVAIICGLIVPRLILAYYGSETNGLISSITQFLSLITLCELGLGSVVQSALYKPLAENDNVEISKIMISSKKFFNWVGIILFIYVAVLLFVFTFKYTNSFSLITTALLVISISITYFAQYFFGIKNQLLVTADQKAYIQLGLHIVTVILNTIACAILIRFGLSIEVVKLVTALIFLIRPFILMLYVRKNYKLDYSIKLNEEPIKQKWNGIAQHFATVILQNTPVVVLTFFSTLTNVSIYNVYFIVVNGVKQIVYSLTNGIQAMFGNMLAKNEMVELNKSFEKTEWLIHTATTLVFSITGVLLVPFISVYTYGVNDANYIVPLFAGLVTIATASYCLRLPYNIMVLAAGHYKQTQLSAIVEAGLNVVLSIILVFKFGLVGVAIGKFISMTYRTVYFAFYLKKNIIYRNIKHFIKHVIVDIANAILIVLATCWIKLSTINYFSWFIMAIEVGVISVIVTLLVNCIFYKHNVIALFKKKRKN